jgi:NAD(P)-dependent dehydrogenase (short-subunit alcohol dehydrogenase family)
MDTVAPGLLSRGRLTESGTVRKVVLVTGASSGLGLALAKQLLLDGDYFLILTSRAASAFRFDDERIVSSESLWVRDLDIVDHAQITTLIAEIDAQLGGVDVLINNAGVAARSTVEDGTDETRQALLDVNYLAPFALIAKVLPMMRQKRWGRIINISSAGGFMAMPTMSAYSASKFALEAASEALWYEMKPWGIRITLIVPGFINSDAYLRTTDTPRSRRGAREPRSTYFAHYQGMRSLIARTMKQVTATNESVAHRISHILRKRNPPLRVHITLEAAVLFWVRKLLPPRFYHWIVYQFLPDIRRWGPDE